MHAVVQPLLMACSSSVNRKLKHSFLPAFGLLDLCMTYYLQVLMVVQQAMEARNTDSNHPDSQARAIKAASACLLEHFRYTPALDISH